MVSLLRRAAPDLALAVAAGLLVIIVVQLRAFAPGVVSVPALPVFTGYGLGLLAVIMVAVSGPLARAGSRPLLSTVALPGRPDPGRPVTRTITRTAAGLIVLVCGLAAAVGTAPVMIITGIVGVLFAGLLVIMVRRRNATVGHRAAVAAALTDYAPRLIIYTSRETGGAYQLAMWLPLLERLGERFVVVVRHPAAQAWAARLTSAPVISAPLAADLDAVIVDTLRVACYVNVVGGNANLIGYRSLRHVYLGHGDSDKEASIHPTHTMFDRIFVAGPAARDRYRQAGLIIPDEKFVIIGRPQLAAVTPAATPIGEVAEPTVLLAPTWRGYNTRTDLSSLPSCRTLARALVRRGAAVAFRPHPLSWENADERALINEVDALLQRDRTTSGRRHRLAAEGRRDPLVEAFNATDALITDVGGLLVDYFATGKPYAVTLSRTNPEPPPTAGAGYLITADRLAAGDLDEPLDLLLRTDPNVDRRRMVAEHYLGGSAPSTEQFDTAIRYLLAGT
ncbi:CDP-glycerol glycerophosphotransferase family protein [Microlunatus speluncae]|uniref:CDP-glycerol glycerophosphotransferase family protein n=1 Tax=Microlunatus speluncae TaxID=2594267 RepID=UPI00126673EF|nr:CDP-glycerol glycerophosphotransferase family protein [Microlunatus speluncae]